MPQTVPSPSRLRYQQVIDRLEIELTQGKYTSGDRLPSLMDLSRSLKVNHLTIRKGLQELARKGLVDIRPRVGVFVTDRPRRAERSRTMRIALGCRSFMLGVSKHHPAIAAYLAGAHAKDHSADFSVQTMFYSRHKLAEELGETILAQNIDGFISTGGVSDQDVAYFARHKIPFVQCGVAPRADDWSVHVRYSTGLILREAVEHLRSLGHQRIAFVCWQHSGDEGAIHREFNRLAFDHRLGDPRELLVLIANPEGDARFEQVEAFFDLKPLPTAVVVFDEFLADVLLASCDRRGIRVPQDLSIASLHDGLPFSHRVPLTAPDSTKLNAEMIAIACEELENWINGNPVIQRDIEVSSELIIKASSGLARRVS